MSRLRKLLFGRIGVRVFVVAVGAMLLFRQLEPSLADWAYETFSLEFEEGPDVGDYEEELVRLVAPEAEAGPLTEGATSRLAELGLALQQDGAAFFVMDRTGGVHYRSTDLQVADEEELTPSTYVQLTVDGEHVGMAYTSVRPFPGEGAPAGYAVLLHANFHAEGEVWDEEQHDWLAGYPTLAIDPDGDLYLQRDRRDVRRDPAFARFRQIRLFVDVAVAVSIAVVLGLFASLFLSRRVVRLSRQTRQLGPDDLPGPFEVRGSDEIAELARSMNAMRDRIAAGLAALETRDRSRAEWVAQVSHDLRTPLTALRVCLDRLETTEGLGERATKALGHARHDALRLQALTEDLVESARLEVGAPLNIEPVLPREVLAGAVHSVGPLAEERGIALDVQTNGAVPECEADGERLLRAAENLLRNAVRHARTRVELGIHAEGDEIVLQVRDDGAGFLGGPGPVDPHAARSHGDTGEGARLGLLVVERVAAAHDGRLELFNLEPQGAQARLSFPYRSASS